jgi:hypothetical protein
VGPQIALVCCQCRRFRALVSERASGTVHAHPSIGGFSDKASKSDIEAAKQTKKNVWVVSQSGLWAVSPDGSVSNVFSDPEWMKK